MEIVNELKKKGDELMKELKECRKCGKYYGKQCFFCLWDELCEKDKNKNNIQTVFNSSKK
jgi:hypothetical protein